MVMLAGMELDLLVRSYRPVVLCGNPRGKVQVSVQHSAHTMMYQSYLPAVAIRHICSLSPAELARECACLDGTRRHALLSIVRIVHQDIRQTVFRVEHPIWETISEIDRELSKLGAYYDSKQARLVLDLQQRREEALRVIWLAAINDQDAQVASLAPGVQDVLDVARLRSQGYLEVEQMLRRDRELESSS